MFLSALFVSLFTFVQFNCENLFDCQHDSLKNDVEFLPDGRTTGRLSAIGAS